MEVELFIHGVPNGEGFWGKEEDRNYFGTFYDHSTDEVKFLIQTRQLKGKPYCYYNFLVYKTPGSQVPNVVANDGRDGSYFGISLRLDAYCKDIANMYRILDTIYNVYVIGSLLKMEKAKLKYMVPDFAGVSNVIANIEKAALQLIQNAFSNEDFVRLDGFALNGGKFPTYNLYDCTPEGVLSAVKQYSKVVVSPYYLSSKELTLKQECNAQIQTIKQQCDARLRADAEARTQEKEELNNKLKSVSNQVSQLQQENGQKGSTINNLNSEISRLKSEINRAGQIKKLSQIVGPIKEPISELATIFANIVPDSSEAKKTTSSTSSQGHHKRGFYYYFKNVICPLVPLANLLLLLVVGSFMWFGLNNTKSFEDSEKQALKEKNDSLENVISDLQTKLEDATPESSQESFPLFDINSVKIDIKEYNGGDLILNKDYHVEIKNSTDNGKVVAEGAIVKETSKSNEVIITPTSNDVKITYLVGNQIKFRELKAK